jgi:hypothetical protein
MSQVSCGELSLFDPCIDLCVNFIEGAPEIDIDNVAGECGGQARAQEAIAGAREKQLSSKAELGDAIAKAFGRAFDQVVEAQAAKLIGDCGLGGLIVDHGRRGRRRSAKRKPWARRRKRTCHSAWRAHRQTADLRRVGC